MPDARYWRWWLRRECKALLLGVGVLALFAGLIIYDSKQAGRPTETFEATVVRFGISSVEEGNDPLVVIKAPDGRIHQLRAHRSKLIGCRAGTAIRLVRRGPILVVDRAGCRLNRRS